MAPLPALPDEPQGQWSPGPDFAAHGRVTRLSTGNVHSRAVCVVVESGEVYCAGEKLVNGDGGPEPCDFHGRGTHDAVACAEAGGGSLSKAVRDRLFFCARAMPVTDWCRCRVRRWCRGYRPLQSSSAPVRVLNLAGKAVDVAQGEHGHMVVLLEDGSVNFAT